MYIPRRAAEPYHPNGNAPPHAADECVLEEVGEPMGGVLPAFCQLQFLPHPQDAARDARNGIGDHEHGMDAGGSTAIGTGD